MGIPGALVQLARDFQEAGVRLYGVGGMVRNPRLGLPISDMDITSALRPEGVLALCQGKGYGVVKKGLAFGMVEIHLGGYAFEHTTFRADTYGPGGGHRPTAIAFSDTVEADAFRRDFTVNALYQDLLTGTVLDPTGGLKDLAAKRLRATSPDPAVILRDDALRVLRLARFCGELGFEPEPGTFGAAQRFVGGLKDISRERVRDELQKILLADGKYGNQAGVYQGLHLLDRLGALEVILPALAAGRGLGQRQEYHAYDVLEHGLQTAAQAELAGGLELRLGALLHDVGKPAAFQATGRMLHHDQMGADIAREMVTGLRFSNQVQEEVSWLVAHHMFDLEGRAKESTLRRRFQEFGAARTRQLIRLRRADVEGSGRNGSEASADRWAQVLAQMLAKGTPFTEADLAITGQDLMEQLGLPPGPAIGTVKAALLRHCAQRPGDNSRERLLAIAARMPVCRQDNVNNS